MRIMAIDFGGRRVGVALSDPSGTIVRPLTLLERKGDGKDIAVMLDLVRDNDVGTVVFGLPYDDDGNPTPFGKKIILFKEKLARQLKHKNLGHVLVDTFDETMTSIDAHDELKGMGVKYARRKKEVDKMAAVLILKGWLENQRCLKDLQ